MSINPIITFKAGACELNDTKPAKVKPKSIPGFIYLYSEDDLIHFCWRPRSKPLSEPELDLVMVPEDGHFVPYEGHSLDSFDKPPNGRIYVLKFSSSSQRYLFWLQSKSQHPRGNASFFSPRDLKIGQIVDQLLQGDDVNVNQEISNIPRNLEGQDGDDDDETMEDVEDTGDRGEHHRAASGGAGAGATGADFREEGEGSREGGADGGRAASAPSMDATSAVANFLQSLQSNQILAHHQQAGQGKPFTTLADLLPPSTTIPTIDCADQTLIDNLLRHVPPTLLILAQEIDDISYADPTADTVKAAIKALSLDQKRDILRKVMRSPQFSQSLGSLTMALRDGGLLSISDAMQIEIRHRGLTQRGGILFGGGDAVEAFLDGIRVIIEKERST